MELINFFEKIGSIFIKPIAVILQKILYSSSKKIFYKHNSSSSIHHRGSRIYDLGSHIFGQIKRRRFLVISTIVMSIGLTGLFFVYKNISKVEAGWWNDTWQYRKKITITSGSSATTDFQVKVQTDTSTLITANKMRSDCGDIRFTSSAGVELPYWVEETGGNACNDTDTNIWVKIDNIPAYGGTYIYMYYGNQSAKTGSNGDNTFEFFDDFMFKNNNKFSYGEAYDGFNAMEYELMATGSGTLRVWSNATWKILKAKLTIKPSDQIRVVTRFKTLGQNYWHQNYLIKDGAGGQGVQRFGLRDDNTVGSRNYQGQYYVDSTGYTTATLSTLTTNTWYKDEIIKKNGTDFEGVIYDDSYSQLSNYTQSQSTWGDETWIWVTWVNQNVSGIYDWIYIRKYMVTDPSATPGSEEQGTGPVAYYSFDEGQGTTVHNQAQTNGENGLVGWWKFDDASSGTSPAPVDTMGRNSGTWVGNAAYSSTAKIGNAATFDGTGDYINAGTNINLSGSSFTLSAWAKRGATGVRHYIMGLGDAGSTDTSLHFGFTNTDIFRCGFYSDDLDTTATYTDSNWHQWVCTYDVGSNTRKIYQDGVLVAQGTATGDFSGSGTFYIGRIGWSDTYHFNGQIDEAKVYNRPLSASEVAINYYSTHGNMMNMTPASDWVDGAQQNPNQKPLGKALDFDGTNDYVIASNSPSLKFADAVSTCAWINPASLPAGGSYILEKRNLDTDDSNYYFQTINSNLTFGIYSSGGWREKTSTATIPLNQWSHVCATFDESNVIFYVNGKSEAAQPLAYSLITSDSPLVIGRSQYSPAYRYFQGKIDEIKLYNSVITADQVKKEYNRGVTAVLGAGQDASRGAPPVGWWKMDEESAYSVFDSSGNNNTATMSGTMTTTDWVPGKVGKGVDFDGTDDVIRVSANSTINNLAVKTIEAWVYPRTTGENSLGRILQKDYVSSGGFYASIDSNNKLVLQQIFSGSNATWTTNNNTLPLNHWTHIAITYDRTSTSNDPVMYINGVSQTVFESVAPSGTVTNEGAHVDLFIGNDQPAGTDRTWDGIIDNVKIYNYARTADQIHYDMATGSPIAYYSFDEGTSTTVHNQQEKNGENGLVGYWKMDENAENSCTGGTNDVCDTMKNNDGGNNFTGSVAGKKGYARDYNGSTYWTNLGNSSTLQLSLPVTITAWVKPDTVSAYGGIFATDSTSGTYYGIWFNELNTGQIHVSWGDGTGGGGANRRGMTSKYALSIGRWHHVAAVVRGATDMSLYINGQDAAGTANGTSTNSLAYSTAPARIGSDGTNYFDGSIDEVKVFNRSLSAEEISNDYNSIHGSMINMDSSTAWVDGARQNPNQKPMGKALNFDGSDDYVVATSSGALDLSNTDDLTISTWVKRDSHDTDDTIVAKRNGVSSGDTGYLLRYTGADDKLFFEVSDGTDEYSLQSSTPITDTNWHHVVATFNKDNENDCNIYVDGRIDSSVTRSGTIANIGSLAGIINLAVGAESDGDSPLDGQIDEVKIYNFVLDSGEVKTEYNRGAAVVLGAGRSPSDTAGGDLVGWWKFDEGAGLSAFDSSGKNHTATASASYSDMWVNGKYGKAMNEYSNPNFCVGDNDDLDGTANLTVSFWVYRSSYTYWYERILSKGWYNGTTGSFNGSWWFQMSGDAHGTDAYEGPNNQYVFWVNTGGSDWDYAESGPVTRGWHHIVGSYDGTTIKIYVDGSLSGSHANSGTIPNSWFALTFGYGSMPDCATTIQNQLTDGYLDEVKIWKKTLTPAEIAWEYNQGKPVYHFNFDQKEATIAANMAGKAVSNKGLVGFWTMDSTSVYDMSGNGNNLTATGSATAIAGIKGNTIDFPPANFQQYYCTDANCGADLDYQGKGLTVSAWIQNDVTPYADKIIVAKQYYTNANYNGGYILYYSSNALYFRVCNSSGSSNCGTASYSWTPSTAGAILTVGVWYHVTASYNGSQIKIYIDGELEGVTNFSGGCKNVAPSDPESSFAIGSNSNGLTTWDGKIDHVKVWQRALSDEEIKIEAQYDEKYGYLQASMDPTTDWVSGRRNGAINLDGTDDGIIIPDQDDQKFLTGENFSLSAWVKRNSFTTADVIIAKRVANAAGNKGYVLQINSSDEVFFEVSDGTDEYSVQTGQRITDSDWHHIVAVFDEANEANTNVFIDGKIDSNQTKSGTLADIGYINNTTNLTIGQHGLGGNYFDGTIDEVKLFRYALSANQVKLDYNFGAAAKF